MQTMTGGSSLRFDVAYTEPRNRLTNAFRLILAIPHLVIANVWNYLTQILALVQWFIILFTGTRNRGLYDMQLAQQAYYARVIAYAAQLFDPWPRIGPEPGDEPIAYTPVAYVDEANRLTSALRLIWIIPAAIIAFFIGIAAGFVGLIAWFAILFTGRHPRGLWDFALRSIRFSLRLNAYGYLMTDEYPKFDSAEPTGQLGAGAHTSPLPPPPSAPAPGSPLPPPR